ncbi:MAG TPA: hypothetical protein VGF45_20395 [Polyangia bacterium]
MVAPSIALLVGVAGLAACEKRSEAGKADNATPAAQAAPGQSAPVPPAAAKPPSSAVPDKAPDKPSATARERHIVGGHAVSLVSEGHTCVLVHRPPGAVADARERGLPLDLTPPCHFLVWRVQPPPRAGAPSDGVSLGTVGAPMAWRYKSANGTIVLGVVGDPLSNQQKADPIIARRVAAGLRCAPSLQGVFLTGKVATLSKKRTGGQVHCVEAGLDEKTFWMLAHDKP